MHETFSQATFSQEYGLWECLTWLRHSHKPYFRVGMPHVNETFSQATFSHTTFSHTTFSHTTFSHTTFSQTIPSCRNASCEWDILTHPFSHTIFSHTTFSHTIFSHTTFSQAILSCRNASCEWDILTHHILTRRSHMWDILTRHIFTREYLGDILTHHILTICSQDVNTSVILKRQSHTTFSHASSAVTERSRARRTRSTRRSYRNAEIFPQAKTFLQVTCETLWEHILTSQTHENAF